LIVASGGGNTVPSMFRIPEAIVIVTLASSLVFVTRERTRRVKWYSTIQDRKVQYSN
jgi:hypothetical protein